MKYPEFYEKVPKFRLYDPLAEFLGAVDKGIMEISYFDCVKLAGHSCPTVAGAYVVTYKALEYLYGNELPVRSEIEVKMKNPKAEGVTGVIGSVAGYICGASDEGGFAGIGGKFSRKNRLSYGNSDINGEIAFKRLDNGKEVSLKIDISSVPGDPQMMPLMQKSLSGTASEEEKNKFASLWQRRVENIVTHKEIWANIAKII